MQETFEVCNYLVWPCSVWSMFVPLVPTANEQLAQLAALGSSIEEGITCCIMLYTGCLIIFSICYVVGWSQQLPEIDCSADIAKHCDPVSTSSRQRSGRVRRLPEDGRREAWVRDLVLARSGDVADVSAEYNYGVYISQSRFCSGRTGAH